MGGVFITQLCVKAEIQFERTVWVKTHCCTMSNILFNVLLTVHLSIILVTDQLNAQILVL